MLFLQLHAVCNHVHFVRLSRTWLLLLFNKHHFRCCISLSNVIIAVYSVPLLYVCARFGCCRRRLAVVVVHLFCSFILALLMAFCEQSIHFKHNNLPLSYQNFRHCFGCTVALAEKHSNSRIYFNNFILILISTWMIIIAKMRCIIHTFPFEMETRLFLLLCTCKHKYFM